MYRLFSIRRSYIKSRSRTLALEKPFIANRPRVISFVGFVVGELAGLGWDWCRFLKKDWVILVSGLGELAALMSASMVWFWILQTRFSRHERVTMRSARMDSMGLAGVSSSRILLRYRSKWGWLSELITSWRVNRPCFTAFCETVALPLRVRGPVDFCALRRLARIWWHAPQKLYQFK